LRAANAAASEIGASRGRTEARPVRWK